MAKEGKEFFKADEYKGGPDEMFEGSKTIIWAPHPDDEIIGCYEVLIRDCPAIIYSGDIENARREEALKLREHVTIGPQLFLMTVPPNLLKEEKC